ncbi:MAG: hypothetical protein GY863_04150 [bacterium]|nr:hypothetical protein [bacterium]
MSNVKNICNRREFFAGSIAGLTSLSGINSGKGFFANGHPLFRKQNSEIIYRTLGRTGISVPVVSMGVMNSDNPELIKSSYDEGVRLFDTAKTYQNGRSEDAVGKVINRFDLREDVIIQTKILHPVGKGYGRVDGPLSEEQVTQMFLDHFESSLSRLQMDYVDILFYHSVDAVFQVHDPGVRKALDRIKDEKKARFLGVSTHQLTDVVDAVIRAGVFDVILAQINFTMDDDEEHIKAIEKAASEGIGIIAMKTQGGNRLASGIMNHRAALKWVLRNENITTAIPGYTNFDQMSENFSASYDLEYTDDEKKFLQDKNVRIGMQFCRQCRKCLDTCPNGIDIPGLMRTHMYAKGYTNFDQARFVFDSIPEEKSLINCRSCIDCSVKCVNHVEVKNNINELKLIYT